MDDHISDTRALTDKAKAALRSAGIIPQLKQAVYSVDSIKNDDADKLKSKALSMAESIQQIIDSGKLSDTDSQKLNGILNQLLGAVQGGKISREALVIALSEASAALSKANSIEKNVTEQQKINQLWQKIETYNENINDDFKKMQEAGIVFDKELIEKRKQLLEYLQQHPQNIEKQKELNAVDDQMLKQAESQLGKTPEAKPYFDDAKRNSDDRHKVVDKDLKAVKERISELNSNTDLDWDASAPKEKSNLADANKIQNVTFDDVQLPIVGQKNKNRTTSISS